MILESEWVINFNGLSGDSRQQGPYSPYKLCNPSGTGGFLKQQELRTQTKNLRWQTQHSGHLIWFSELVPVVWSNPCVNQLVSSVVPSLCIKLLPQLWSHLEQDWLNNLPCHSQQDWDNLIRENTPGTLYTRVRWTPLSTPSEQQFLGILTPAWWIRCQCVQWCQNYKNC